MKAKSSGSVLRKLTTAISLALSLAAKSASCALQASADSRGDDLVAPPIALARLASTLEACVTPPPTAEELLLVSALHREMVDSYGASGVGSGGQAWRTGNTLYDELRALKRDPTRAQAKELVRLQVQMLSDADAAERTMFDSIAAVLAADESDETTRTKVLAEVARARVLRETDRLLASFPLGEPTGVRTGLRDALGRLGLTKEVRTQVDAILSERELFLAPALRHELREYHAFVIAAAAAFDELFGGALPPAGVIFSEDQEKWLRENMRSRCEREGEAFLAARRGVRSHEDATVRRICAVLSAEEAVELQLRLSPAITGSNYLLLGAEGHVRDALRDLPLGSPARASVAEFAPRWRKALTESIERSLDAARRREDTTFWSPTPARGSLLELQSQYEDFDSGTGGGRALLPELDRILAPTVMAAGGKLGNLQATDRDSNNAWLLERRSMGAWREELASGDPVVVSSDDRIALIDIVSFKDEKLTPQQLASFGLIRRGIASRLDRATIESPMLASALDLACRDAAWIAYDARWSTEVEDAVAALTDARRTLRTFSSKYYWTDDETENSSNDLAARTKALQHALVLRDTAWRAAESCDEELFHALLTCARELPEPIRREIELSRCTRAIERESRGFAKANSLGRGVDAHPDWVSIVRGAGLDPDTQTRVERSIVACAPRMKSDSIARRQIAFDLAAAADATFLGLRDTAFYRQKLRSSSGYSDAQRRAAVATADFVGALLDAAEAHEDLSHGAAQRALLEHAFVQCLYREWTTDPIVRRTAALARHAAKSEEEIAAVDRALDTYLRADRAANERDARLALAASSIARTSNGTILFAMPSQAAVAGSDERLEAQIARERADLQTEFDIELLSILDRDRWALVSPPDIFELNGVGSRDRLGAQFRSGE